MLERTPHLDRVYFGNSGTEAVEAAVSAAVADAEMRTQEEVAAASVAMKAAAEAQQLRELEDRVDALQGQLAATTDAQLAAQAALT